MVLGRRRKKKQKQRAAWDAVAATLEAPPPAPAPVAPAPVAPVKAASPIATVDPAGPHAEFSAPEPVMASAAATAPPVEIAAVPAPVAPPLAPDPEPVPSAEAPLAPPDVPLAPTEIPPAMGPPVFRFTPTGTTEGLSAVPDEPHPAPPATPLATAPPLPTAPPLATAAPLPPLAAAPPVAPSEFTAPLAPARPLATAPPLAPTAPVAAVTSPAPPAPIAAPVVPTLPPPSGRVIEIPRLTRSMAQRMRGAQHEMAQLSMNMDAWMDQAVEMRTQLLAEWDDETLRPSYTDFVVRAVARALVQHPELNAIVRGDAIELLSRVHVGITLPCADGVNIPVVRDADRRSLKTIAAASRGFEVTDGGPRSLSAPGEGSNGVAWQAPDDAPTAPAPGTDLVAASADPSSLDTDVDAYGPPTFVVASLGIYGVDAFTPVVLSPNVATLAVGRVRDATRWEGDHPIRASAMTLTLAWDHRAVDGISAAEFLAEVRDILEQPYRLLVD